MCCLVQRTTVRSIQGSEQARSHVVLIAACSVNHSLFIRNVLSLVSPHIDPINLIIQLACVHYWAFTELAGSIPWHFCKGLTLRAMCLLHFLHALRLYLITSSVNRLKLGRSYGREYTMRLFSLAASLTHHIEVLLYLSTAIDCHSSVHTQTYKQFVGYNLQGKLRIIRSLLHSTTCTSW